MEGAAGELWRLRAIWSWKIHLRGDDYTLRTLHPPLAPGLPSSHPLGGSLVILKLSLSPSNVIPLVLLTLSAHPVTPPSHQSLLLITPPPPPALSPLTPLLRAPGLATQALPFDCPQFHPALMCPSSSFRPPQTGMPRPWRACLLLACRCTLRGEERPWESLKPQQG